MKSETIWRDCEGTPINIGDEVIYIDRRASRANLQRGKVTGIKRGRFAIDTLFITTVESCSIFNLGKECENRAKETTEASV